MSEINRNQRFEKKIYLYAKSLNWIFLICSVLLLSYAYYYAEIITQGQNNTKSIFLYIFSIVGILLWLLLLRLGDKIRVNIIIISISLVIGVYFVEGVLNFVKFGHTLPELDDRIAAATELGIVFDERSKLEVVEDLNAEGFDAVTLIKSQNFDKVENELLTLAGISRITTVEGNESGKYSIYQSDRYGFNNPDEEWDSSQVHWLLTGDSFAHGFAVQPEDSIAGQIRSITNSNVINLGMSGNGPLTELAVLKEYAETLRPKNVLWLYYEGNDLRTDIQDERQKMMLVKYLQDNFSQNLMSRQQEIDIRLKEYIIRNKEYEQERLQVQTAKYKTRWMRLYEIRKLIGFGVNVESEVNPDSMFINILKKAKDRTEGWGGKLYFVYLPEFFRYSDVVEHNQFRKKSEVLNLVMELDIPIVDIHQEVFAEHHDPLALFPLRLFGHYNTDGYSEVAKAILKSVNKYKQSDK